MDRLGNTQNGVLTRQACLVIQCSLATEIVCLERHSLIHIRGCLAPQMKSPIDDLPPVTKAKLPFEPYPGATGVIGQIFGNTDTTYKLFWFLAVLEETKNAPPRSDLSLELNQLTREMVAQAWPCRRLFKLWFGHQDRLQTLIDRLAERSSLSDSARADEVRNASRLLSDDEVVILENYVPYRFLVPWFRSALVGVKDHARHSLIQLLAERSARSPRPAPYHFNTVIGRPRIISISSKWLTFFQSNHLPLKAFSQLSLARYFETRNPGIPGIINKLERPGARKHVSSGIRFSKTKNSAVFTRVN
jgi:hypothetical protein